MRGGKHPRMVDSGRAPSTLLVWSPQQSQWCSLQPCSLICAENRKKSRLANVLCWVAATSPTRAAHPLRRRAPLQSPIHSHHRSRCEIEHPDTTSNNYSQFLCTYLSAGSVTAFTIMKLIMHSCATHGVFLTTGSLQWVKPPHESNIVRALRH